MSLSAHKPVIAADQERQRAFVFAAWFFWSLVLLYLLVRDPLWQMLYKQELVSGLRRPVAGWATLDESLMRRLGGMQIRPTAGNESVESDIAAAVQERRDLEIQRAVAAASTMAPSQPSPMVESTVLRDLARSRAATRLALDPDEELVAPELVYAQTYLALSQPTRLVQTIEVYQLMQPPRPADQASFARELVAGWMNGLRFNSIITHGGQLEMGAAAVMSQSGEMMVNLVLMEVFVELNENLPAVANEGTAIILRWPQLGQEGVGLYLKRPSDSSYYPITLILTGTQFEAPIALDQEGGIYALRAERAGRLSDPRPIFVQ